ncbi:TPA: trypsin-like peptidase domain-containing protein [Pseudomonas aeruginosa]|nr:trypsin-like peptidase domain-containing protein [Pseudomonas aeruginosa]
MHLNEFVVNCTVRIDSFNDDTLIGHGTGFFCTLAQEAGSTIFGLITNKHVIANANNIRILLSIQSPKGELRHSSHRIDLNNTTLILHPRADIDACSILVGQLLNSICSDGSILAHTFVDHQLIADHKTFSEILPLEEVTMIGYPIGLMDAVNNGAIARRGIIASDPTKHYDGRPEFVIDMACMPGSSGSPVFLANAASYTTRKGGLFAGTRCKLLGLLWGGPERNVEGQIIAAPVPMNVTQIAVTRIPINLGFVIKATELTPIFEEAKKILTKPLAKPDWKA